MPRSAVFNAPGGGGASVTVQNAKLASDVAMAATNTFYDGPSLSLVAGTYIVIGQVDILNNGASGQIFTARIWDGTTIYGQLESQVVGSGLPIGIALATVITLGSTTTIKISAAYPSFTTGTIKAIPTSNGGSSATATQLTAIKIA